MLTGEKREAMVIDMKSFEGSMVGLSVGDSNADMCWLLVDFRIAMSLLVPSADAGADSDAQEPDWEAATFAHRFVVQRRAVHLLEALSQLKEKAGKDKSQRGLACVFVA
jgi:hypothetical protein